MGKLTYAQCVFVLGCINARFVLSSKVLLHYKYHKVALKTSYQIDVHYFVKFIFSGTQN